jgi:hypothetical protein
MLRESLVNRFQPHLLQTLGVAVIFLCIILKPVAEQRAAWSTACKEAHVTDKTFHQQAHI